MTPLSSFLLLFLFIFFYVHAETKSSRHSSSSSANASSLSFPNTSSTINSGFSYIIPYGQTQDCDIYGPICQTGSITVGVNLTTATTTTVLPCSSYLSAQSMYVVSASEGESVFANEGWAVFPWVEEWARNFGQSPQCISDAKAMSRGQDTFSNCNYPLSDMPGLVRYYDPADPEVTCCGNCSVEVLEVRLYYFPEKTAINCHNNQTSNSTSTMPARTIDKRMHSLVANGSTTVVSGHTFTSPSIYLQLLGTVTVNDRCTTVGSKLINPIITLPPGGLSTWKPVFDAWYTTSSIGGIWSDPSGDMLNDVEAGVSPLDVRDLACPTWGLGKSTSADGTVVTTIGPPWLPLIVPPFNVFSLDPTWAAVCTGIYSGMFSLSTFALFDPPSALTPAPLLLPTPPAHPTPAPVPADPTSIPEQAKSSTEAVKPASLPNDPAAPAKTGDPGKNNPAQSPNIATVDPAGSANPPENSVASSKNESDLPSDSSSDLPSDPKAPSVDRDQPSSSAPESTSGGSQQSPTDPKVPIVSVPKPVEGAQTQAQGLGAIIYNAFGKTGPEPDRSSISLPPQSVFAVGAHTITANPTGFTFNSVTIAPGGTAQTVDGTTLSLDKLGVLAVGSSTFSLTNPLATPIQPNPSAFFTAGTIVSAGDPAVTIDDVAISLDHSGTLAIGSTTMKAFTVAGQVFTSRPSAFFIAGTTISADGPAVTIGGTIISLGQHGALKIGSSTIDLPTSLYNSFGQAYTVAGQVFTPNPSAFSVVGTTISAGGPGATVGGTIISLEPSGTLVVGSSTIRLSPQTAVSSDVDIDGFDVIVHSSFAVVDGVTVSAAAAGVTVSGNAVSLEAGGATLNIGTGRFAFPTPVAGTNGSVNVQAFVDGQGKNLEMSLYLVWGVCGTLLLWLWH